LTTDPAATTQPFFITTPGKIVDLAPIQTPSSIVTGLYTLPVAL